MHHDFLCYNYSLEKPFVFIIVCVLEFSYTNERASQWYSFCAQKLTGRRRSSRDYLLYFKQVAKTGNAITNADDKTPASVCRKHKLKNAHLHELKHSNTALTSNLIAMTTKLLNFQLVNSGQFPFKHASSEVQYSYHFNFTNNQYSGGRGGAKWLPSAIESAKLSAKLVQQKLNIRSFYKNTFLVWTSTFLSTFSDKKDMYSVNTPLLLKYLADLALLSPPANNVNFHYLLALFKFKAGPVPWGVWGCDTPQRLILAIQSVKSNFRSVNCLKLFVWNAALYSVHCSLHPPTKISWSRPCR